VCWLFLGFHFPPLKIFDQEGTSSSFAETELFMTFFDVTTFYFEHYFFHYLVSYKLFPSSEKQTFVRSKIVSLQDAIPSFPHCEQFIKADWFFYSSILTELSCSLVLFVCVFFTLNLSWNRTKGSVTMIWPKDLKTLFWGFVDWSINSIWTLARWEITV